MVAYPSYQMLRVTYNRHVKNIFAFLAKRQRFE